MKYFIELRDHSVHEIDRYQKKSLTTFSLYDEWWNDWLDEHLGDDAFFYDPMGNKYFAKDVLYFWSES